MGEVIGRNATFGEMSFAYANVSGENDVVAIYKLDHFVNIVTRLG